MEVELPTVTGIVFMMVKKNEKTLEQGGGDG